MKSDPLTENLAVRQRQDEGHRRWFVNSFFDLIVWYDSPGGQLTGFQFCYSRNLKERAFTWTSDYTSSHIVSDTFIEKGVSRMGTGILKGDGGPIPASVVDRFRDEAAALDLALRDLIISKIKDYNAGRPAEDPIGPLTIIQ
ncbi:MAG: hypothetical protein A2087_07415 [Spirochaetes bacterium GWD1_61_31]|nr:MAG: hypothetical protein A2Y37_08060 [Spirochaetes bacterium GWB1_60_80]OHD34239.1 MAG: hypothetical protein A2004_12685 [Spirochaetes bacterium GWC1_61_12]OHD40167.1 MAG: hypothetical protein A2087_07415 [Spirochaetes bacterium GWD1_61_31]OHD45785.1 MAG: hypothetical protein A2Y35_03695 [Spirochaetes bacterium GWE1_60_18]OHD58329.1 MAG: hypothetical protein A2Y32_06085 [Spirochaetes bacterium GWF1_60_12]HAW86324.1 hypothetical protein [Spirochaetaceae bacterium]